MFITPMEQLNKIQDTSKIGQVGNQSVEKGGFQNVLQQVVSDVKETEDNLAKEQYRFTTGQTDNTHDLTIAANKAQISVDLLVSLRNKALESYNELIKMGL